MTEPAPTPADLSTHERLALMIHLRTARDLFASDRPRLAEWFSDRLCELDDDGREERRLLEQLTGPDGTAELLGPSSPEDDEGVALFEVPPPEWFGDDDG